MQQTPLAKLRNKKEWIRLESREKEEKLHEHFSYLKENAGSLALSGLSSLVFSGSKNNQKENRGKYSKLASKPKELFSPSGLLNSLSYGKGIFPVVLEIAQPFLITWGFKTVKKLLKKVFTKKRN